MHVGINALFLNPVGAGGIGTYLRSILRAMSDLDPSVTYTLFANRENAGTFGIEAMPRVREVRCPISARHRPLRLAYEYAILPMQVQRCGIDVLFSPAFTGPARARYASVVTVHDLRHEDWPETFPRAHRLLLTHLTRRSVRAAAQILTVSEHAKRRIEAVYRIPAERITVTYLAADPWYSERLDGTAIACVLGRLAVESPYIFSLAAPGHQKNLDTLVDAYILLRRTAGTPIRLALAGAYGDAIAGLRRRVADAGFATEMRELGWVDTADLPALYQGAAMFVMPSRYEGFGIPIVEAMASGTPVVTTTATSLPEVAGDAAVLVDPEDAASIATAMRRLLDDAALRADLIARGEARARQLTWERAARQTLAVLHRAASGHQLHNMDGSR